MDSYQLVGLVRLGRAGCRSGERLSFTGKVVNRYTNRLKTLALAGCPLCGVIPRAGEQTGVGDCTFVTIWLQFAC